MSDIDIDESITTIRLAEAVIVKLREQRDQAREEVERLRDAAYTIAEPHRVEWVSMDGRRWRIHEHQSLLWCRGACASDPHERLRIVRERDDEVVT